MISIVFFFVAAVIFFAVFLFRAKNNTYSAAVIDDLELISDHSVTFDIYDDSNPDFMNIMPVHDALTLENANLKRKLLFTSFKGDCLKLYPFLTRALRDKDAEIVHYASSVITDCRREIYEGYEDAKTRYAAYPGDCRICREYANSLYLYICWEELNKIDTTCLRKELQNIHNALFNFEKNHLEMQYKQKIGNELKLREFSAAHDTCILYILRYPESAEAYLSLLELYYSARQADLFKDTMAVMRNEEVLSDFEADGILSFWESRLTLRRGVL